jgi:hypothetical protein
VRSKADLHYGLCGQGKFPPALLRKAGGEFPFPPRPLPPGHSVWQGDEEFPIGGREPEWRRAATGEPREPAPLVTPQPDSSARDRSTTAHPEGKPAPERRAARGPSTAAGAAVPLSPQPTDTTSSPHLRPSDPRQQLPPQPVGHRQELLPQASDTGGSSSALTPGPWAKPR